jgi:phage terminase large subunit-like protein
VTYTIYNKAERKFYCYSDYYLPETTLQDHPNRELYKRWAEMGYLKICKGDVVDYRMIVGDILAMNRKLLILNIGYDAYKSQECVNMLAAAGAMNVLIPVPQTYGNFTSPVETFEMAARTGKVVLANNPINFYCFGNAVLDTDRNENKKPIKRSANQKIDSVITTLMTFWLFNNYQQ